MLKAEAKRGVLLPFVIEVDGAYVGQLTIGNLQRGAVRSAWIGYWVDKEWTGQGIATAAVALGVDHAFGPVGLHRLEATVQPTNAASRTVLTKVGFRHEGLLKRYMDVDGRWRDHDLFAMTTEEVVSSASETLVRAGRAFPMSALEITVRGRAERQYRPEQGTVTLAASFTEPTSESAHAKALALQSEVVAELTRLDGRTR